MEEQHQGMDRAVTVVVVAYRRRQRSMSDHHSRGVCRSTSTTPRRHGNYKPSTYWRVYVETRHHPFIRIDYVHTSTHDSHVTLTCLRSDSALHMEDRASTAAPSAHYYSFCHGRLCASRTPPMSHHFRSKALRPWRSACTGE